MELKSFFPLGVMSGQRAFGEPGLVRENPLYPMTSVTEGEVCVCWVPAEARMEQAQQL